MSSFLVAPSILSADFSKLGDEIKAVEAAGADWIHVDVMDGHFVPNLTLGAPIVKCIRPVTQMPLDVHLMIEEPERYIEDFVKAGADYLTIHIEATKEPVEVLKKIRSLGCKPGITLRPKTPLSAIEKCLEYVDLVLIMTVEPGFGGQSFMHDQIEKMAWLRNYISETGHNILIEVDGGINAETAPLVKDVDVLVAGSYVFKNNYQEAIGVLKGVRS